jgi:DNA-binding Lrp family transcriptional regulator
LGLALDTTDRRIIALLVEDGRMPCSEIARRLGDASERSVRYRIGRLRRSGAVRISAIVNPAAFGYETIADLVIDVAPGWLQDVAAQLVDLDQVSYIAGSVGDPEELVRLVNEAIGSIPGVVRVRTAIVPWKLKEVCDWQVPADAVEVGPT